MDMNTGKLYIILVTVVLAFSSCRHEPLQTSIAPAFKVQQQLVHYELMLTIQ